MKASDENYNAGSARYRQWLEQYLEIDDADWKKREENLAQETSFGFLRATFFRWAHWWPETCKALHRDVPRVLGVGDLHAENFGTWRDVEGRLVWGVNDFDECCRLPYTNDLVRLAASAKLAIEEQGLNPLEQRFQEACAAILRGYGGGIGLETDVNSDFGPVALGRSPFVLAEEHDWLRDVVQTKLCKPEKKPEAGAAGTEDPKDPWDKFWDEMKDLPPHPRAAPHSAIRALHASMPESDLEFSVRKRDAGKGSAGRLRFTAVVKDWQGAALIREAKALAPSAWNWWKDGEADGPNEISKILCGELLRRAVRARDPWVQVHLGAVDHCWVVRRLAPDAGKIKLDDLPQGGIRDNAFWCAMGRELANVHVPLGPVSEHLRQLSDRDPQWLPDAAERMVSRTIKDWEQAQRG